MLRINDKEEIIKRKFIRNGKSAVEIKKALTTSHNINLTKLTRVKTACIIHYVNQIDFLFGGC